MKTETGKFETETDKFGYIRFISVLFQLNDRGNVDWAEVSLLLGCSSLVFGTGWMDASFSCFQCSGTVDMAMQPEIEEVSDGLTEYWCRYTEKPGRPDSQ